MKQFYQKIKPLLPVITLVLGICVLSFFIPKEAIKALVIKSGIFAPLVFIFINLLTFIFAPLLGTPVMAIGYWVFGNQVVLLGFIVVVLATITNFWISRLWGIKLITKLAGRDNMNKVNHFMKDYGLVTLFFSRLFLRGFVDVISYAAGLTSIKFAPYLVVSILADIPGTLLLFYLSTLTKNTTSFTIIMVGISAVLLVIFSWFKKVKK